MAKTDYLRVHLILPEDGSDELESGFRDRFYQSYTEFDGYFGDLEGEKYLNSRIIEDRPDHREDIQEIFHLAKSVFPDADVLMTQQYSPRNRNEESYLGYSYDILIRVCNVNSSSPSITQKIQLTNPRVRGSNNPYHQGKFIIQTEADDADLVALDLQTGVEAWRQNVRFDKLSRMYGFDEGVVYRTRSNLNTLFATNWDDGSELWTIEDVTSTDDARATSFDPVVETGQLYVGDTFGKVYEIDIESGRSQEITALNREVKRLSYDSDDRLFAILAQEPEATDEDDSQFSRGRTNKAFSVVCVDGQDVEWEVDVGEASNDIPSLLVADGVIAVIDTDGVLRAFDAETGAEHWIIDRGTVAEAVGEEDDETKTDAERELNFSRSDRFSVSTINSVGKTICGIAELGTDNYIIGIELDSGEIKWTNNGYNASSYNTGQFHNNDGEIVFNHYDNEFVTSFVALDTETGAENWRFATPGWTGCDTPIDSGFVFVTSEECILLNC